MQNTPFPEWENMPDKTWGCPVFGGWFVITTCQESSVGIFVPDPNHEWIIEEENQT